MSHTEAFTEYKTGDQKVTVSYGGETKEFTVTMAQRTATVTVDSNAVSMAKDDVNYVTATITNGTASVESSDESKVTAEIAENGVVTLTCVDTISDNVTVTITVKPSDGGSDVTATITVSNKI